MVVVVFIEIGHKFIHLWLWSCHFLRLQLVYQNVFSRYWTILSNEWKWFHWNWTKINWFMVLGMSCFSVTTCFFKTFFSIFNVSMGRLKWNKASINVEFNHLSNGGSGFIEIGHKIINLWLWSCHFLCLQLVYQNVFSRYWTFLFNWPFLLYHISIDAESKYLSNNSGFIEIGQKLIELWCWECHVFPLQLVLSKRFFRFLTFLWAVWNETKHQSM
jgi:hypothetical protein